MTAALGLAKHTQETVNLGNKTGGQVLSGDAIPANVIFWDFGGKSDVLYPLLLTSLRPPNIFTADKTIHSVIVLVLKKH